MAKIHTRIKFEQWHRFINNIISGIALTEGDLKKRINGEFYLQTEEKQIPVSVEENPGDDGYYLITITTKKGKGWHESPGRDGKAPRHKAVAERAQAKHAQNTPMKRKKETPKQAHFSSPYRVDVWEERDRLIITVYDANDKEVASWVDDDARQMFEDGFFDSRDLEQSVLNYLEHNKIIKGG